MAPLIDYFPEIVANNIKLLTPAPVCTIMMLRVGNFGHDSSDSEGRQCNRDLTKTSIG